jgi:hypothetical protein
MRAGQLMGPTGGQPPQRGLGGIPDKINNNDMLDIRSNVTGGLDGGDQEMVGGTGEDQPNPPEDNQGANKRAKAQEGQLPQGSKPSPLAGMTFSLNANSTGEAGLRGTQTSAQHSGTKPSTKQICLLSLL